MVKTIVLLAGLLMTLPSLALTKVSASIDKNPVTVKESIVLTVVADDDIEAHALDTSPLLEDFIVGRTSVSRQTSMVNFNTSRTTKWTTLLFPKKQGKVTIPALKVENQQTTPISIVVLGADDPSAQQQKDLFVTAEVSNKDVYVQQMLTLTVKIHISTELQSASLGDPSLEGATITKLEKNRESETIINGRRYRVVEVTYLITPQQSGDFTLTSPIFSGEVMVQSRRRSNFLSFGETKPISVIGDEIAINVRPIPGQFQGQWLPSELLTLHEEWQPKDSEFKVGEPITRTLTLTAAGVASEQLPTLDFSVPDGLKVYPDQAELHSSLNGERLISQSVRNFAIVASQPGEYRLPEITIPWWNTVTNRMETAILPAKAITIKPNTDLPPTTAVPANHVQDNIAKTSQTIIVEKTPWLQWLFLALWLLTSLAWIIQTLRRNQNPKTSKNAQQHVNDVHLAMLAACKKSDGIKAMNLLLPWVKSIKTHTSITTINEAKSAFTDNEFNQAVDELYHHFYSNKDSNPTTWNGQKLSVALMQIYKKQSQTDNTQKININP